MFSRIRTTRNKREIIEVGWTPVPKPPEITLTMDKPDHLYTSIYSDIDSAFKLCPAFTAFFKNYYIVRSPIDIKFVIKKITDYDAIITIEDKKIEEYVTFDDRKTEWSHDYRNPFDPKLKLEKNNNPMISFSLHQLFFADEDVTMEQIPPFLHMHELKYFNHLRMIPGGFNIRDWIRPLDFAYELMLSDYIIIDIKRNDPLCYVNFRSNNKIKIKQVPWTEDLEMYSRTTVGLKGLVPGLGQLYEKFRKFRKPKLL